MILFVCSQGKFRSRTAELMCLFAGVYARSAGTDPDAEVQLNNELISEASLIFCMERKHHQIVTKMPAYATVDCPVVSLGILDLFERLQPELMRDLVYQVQFHDKALAAAMENGRQVISTLAYAPKLGTGF